MRLEEYRLFLTDLTAEISRLLANNKALRRSFRTNCEKVRKNGRLAEWMEWYYKPAAVNTFQPPDVTFTPTRQEEVQAAYCALAIIYDSVVVPHDGLSTISRDEMKNMVETSIDKPRPSPAADFGFLSRTRARLLNALELARADLISRGLMPIVEQKVDSATGTQTDEETIEIKQSDFNKSKSLNLLKDLVADTERSGVSYDAKRHPKSPVRTLNELLRSKNVDPRVKVKTQKRGSKTVSFSEDCPKIVLI